MRRLFVIGALLAALVVSTSPPAFAAPQDDDPADAAQVAPHVDVEQAPAPATGAPAVELVQAFAPGYAEPLGGAIQRTARIDVPPPNATCLKVGDALTLTAHRMAVRRVWSGRRA